MKTNKEIEERASLIAEKTLKGGEKLSHAKLKLEMRNILKNTMVEFYKFGYNECKKDMEKEK